MRKSIALLNEREACDLLRCGPKTLRRRRLASPDRLGAVLLDSPSPHGRRYLYPAERIRALIEAPLTLDQVRAKLVAKYGLNNRQATPAEDEHDAQYLS